MGEPSPCAGTMWLPSGCIRARKRVSDEREKRSEGQETDAVSQGLAGADVLDDVITTREDLGGSLQRKADEKVSFRGRRRF